MKNEYKFEYKIVDENGETIIEDGTSFDYEDIRPFGDCKVIDEDLGNFMRRFIRKVDNEYLEKEIIKDLTLR